MTRGNQRDKAREKNLKDQAGSVRPPNIPRAINPPEYGPISPSTSLMHSYDFCSDDFRKAHVTNLQTDDLLPLQKKKNTQSGTEFQKTKEAQAAIMRAKQEAGMAPPQPITDRKLYANRGFCVAAAKQSGEAAGGGKKK